MKLSIIGPASVYLISIVLGTMAAPSAYAQLAGDTILIDQPVDTDLYLAGDNVDILADVSGDVVAAARQLIIAGDISEDVIIAGETLSIQANIEDDLRAVGKLITLTGNVDGHMVAAGQRLSIGVNSRIGEWAWLAGETIEILGNIDGEVKAAGNLIIINGVISGNVDIYGEDLRIGSDAVIQGDLNWHSETLIDLHDNARIIGQVAGGMTEDEEDDEEWDSDSEVGDYIFKIFSLASGAILFYLLIPGFCQTASGLVKEKPWQSIGLGLAILICTPFVSLLLLVTLIGFLPAIALITTYFAYLIVGFLAGLIVAGYLGLFFSNKLEAATKLTWVSGIFLMTIIMVIAWEIPYIGTLLFLLTWIAGSGAISLGLVQQYQRRQT
ncbi:MAG: polymer-forming cytoskeletal protein [Gammaproteobacteria bacterium]|nr:polymer-forming cytoskeletal protein [Gammaproteobacteria bacterium]